MKNEKTKEQSVKKVKDKMANMLEKKFANSLFCGSAFSLKIM